MERRRPQEEAATSGGLYFASEKSHIKFIHSGSTLLDCALGGGWVLGRIANIIGDKSTGKTLLAMEAMINFLRRYPRGRAYFRERESAFDRLYAAAMGLPVSKIDFGPQEIDKKFHTVEGFQKDLRKIIDKHLASKQPAIYVLDSLDSLSDDAEMKKGTKILAEGEKEKGSYGTAKAKHMSEMFRKLVRDLEEAQVFLLIISQIRDKIGVQFGKKTTRTGGHALDFYASHVIELAHLGRLYKERSGVKRAVGVEVRAQVSKNKIGLPFREAQFDIKFGYGVEDLSSCVDWLYEVKRLEAIGLTKDNSAEWLIETNRMEDADFKVRHDAVTAATKRVWMEVENAFLPVRKKYPEAVA